MAYKETMNKIDIKRYHDMLKEDIDLELISKSLLITEETLKKFSPDIVKEVKKIQDRQRKALLKGENVDVKFPKKVEKGSRE